MNSTVDRTETALITGASSGIGLELARLLAQNGYGLILVARTAQRLEELGAQLRAEFQVEVAVLPADLSVAGAAQQLFAQIDERGLSVDVLVNNAGFATYGLFRETDLAIEVQEIELNVVSLTVLTKLCLPGMLSRGRGRVLNVASTAAFQPGPLMSVYFATKAYVLSFSEALSEELEGTGVTVTALCPGPTVTGFRDRAEMQSSKLFRQRRVMPAAKVAATGYAGMLAGKRIVIPGWQNKLLAQAVRISPRALVTKLVRGMQAPVEE